MFAWKKLKKTTKRKSKKQLSALRLYGWLSAGLVAGLLVVFGIIIYWTGTTNAFARVVSRVLPYPTVFVNGMPTSYTTYARSVDALEVAFTKQEGTDFKDTSQASFRTEIRGSVLSHLVEDSLVRQLAERYGVTVSKEKVDLVMKSIVGENQENLEAVETELADKYEWTLDDYMREVVMPSLYREELQKVLVTDEELNQDAYNKALEVLALARDSKNDFAELAKEYSDGPSAESGGDLGTTEPGAFVTEFEDAARALEVGGVSDIVKTQYGFHIIKLEEKEGETIHVRHILIQGLDFENWFYEQMAEAVVWIPLFNFYWDAENGTVQTRKTETGLEESNWTEDSTGATETDADATEEENTAPTSEE